MIVVCELLNVKQRQAISETPAKGGGGGSVETCSDNRTIADARQGG
jgi:hypothetical protein